MFKMLNIFKNKAHKASYVEKEIGPERFIPYKCHWNSNTILTKSNEFLQIIKIEGFSFETADDDDLDNRKELRNSMLKNLASGSVTLYFHTIRKRKPIGYSGLVLSYDPTVKSVDDFVSYLNSEWKKKYSTFDTYFNEHYISILYKADKGGAAIIEHFIKQIQQSTDKSIWENEMRDMAQSVEEISARVMSSFKDYEPSILGVKELPEGNYCEMLEFLGTIVNCGQSMPMLVPKEDIDKYIPTNRLFFGKRSLEAKGPNGKKYAGMVSIHEYGPKTYAGIFDSFLQMPFEFIISQSFNFANRTVAISQMQMQQNRMIQADDKAVSQIAEINEALDLAMSGTISFGQHHFTILAIDDDIKNLESTLSLAAVELSNCGMQTVRETVNLEASYWGQLPGNMSYLIRKSTINTYNLASFASMHNYPLGKVTGNHWGEYVTVLETTSGTPFFFNFHVRDVGHTLIIGPTGAGKTVLMNFLCAQAQKFKPRLYFFDKDRGAEIFLRAIGGVYTKIDPGQQCNFNPLLLPDTGENRTFLLEWLKILVTVNGETLSAEDLKLLTQAISGNFRLNHKDRRLSNIVAFLGMDGPGTLAGRIAMWHGLGSHAKIFDNEVDNIDLSSARVFGFEMAELLKDPTSLSPVLLYIFHRINLSLDGLPTMIVLDEAWALIDNPIFAPKIKDWLKVLRKLNTFVVFATQSVEDAIKSRISDTLIQQTATQIFLPNLKATEAYRTGFMLSQREYEIIKTTDPSARFFLIKQGINSVVGRVSLSGMTRIINVLSGRTETVLLLDRLRAEFGDNPENWLDKFYYEAERLK